MRPLRLSVNVLIISSILLLVVACKKDSNNDMPVTIGQIYQGGVVAYILRPGDIGYDANVQHGLIAASSDQSKGAEWGCYGLLLGATETAIGSGSQNTNTIITNCSSVGIAAKLCADLEIEEYNDWYLPSKEELLRVHDNRTIIGGFESSWYWSSSEYNQDEAWLLDFDGTGFNMNQYKAYGNANVRAVRKF